MSLQERGYLSAWCVFGLEKFAAIPARARIEALRQMGKTVGGMASSGVRAIPQAVGATGHGTPQAAQRAAAAVMPALGKIHPSLARSFVPPAAPAAAVAGKRMTQAIPGYQQLMSGAMNVPSAMPQALKTQMGAEQMFRAVTSKARPAGTGTLTPAVQRAYAGTVGKGMMSSASPESQQALRAAMARMQG